MRKLPPVQIVDKHCWAIVATITRSTRHYVPGEGWVGTVHPAHEREYHVYAESPEQAKRMVADYLSNVGIMIAGGVCEKQSLFSLSEPEKIGYTLNGVVFMIGNRKYTFTDDRKAPGA